MTPAPVSIMCLLAFHSTSSASRNSPKEKKEKGRTESAARGDAAVGTFGDGDGDGGGDESLALGRDDGVGGAVGFVVFEFERGRTAVSSAHAERTRGRRSVRIEVVTGSKSASSRGDGSERREFLDEERGGGEEGGGHSG